MLKSTPLNKNRQTFTEKATAESMMASENVRRIYFFQKVVYIELLRHIKRNSISGNQTPEANAFR